MKGKTPTMNPEMIPYTFEAHIVFCIIGVITFIYQFCRYKYGYYVLSAVALAASLLIYVDRSENFFYTIGIAELAMIIVIWVMSLIEPRMRAKKKNNISNLESKTN
jgi:predicted membrane protein